MAKTAKVKKRQSTLHSRAARRAVSPSDPSISKSLDKSMTRSSASPPPHPASTKPHVLAAQNAGITKKSKSKPVKRAQRLRQLKGMERAADNMDKLELKRMKSVGKEKKVKERAKGWEEVNGVWTKKKKTKNTLEEDEQEKRGGREWVSDEEMDDTAAGTEDAVPDAIAGEVKELEVVVPASVPLPVATEVDEYL
ncbi:hypothetical protein K458DRAFT_309438 [Lentithecium fluviatile CBS 122367]|uniref:Ribosome biogenesis protein Alb1 n=1 Tax=Lentithecium fluviatile CBS 122367 TaxID=1168545 RepID=A0A6G1IU89_9PLEO|nr:hypothetical protein K458DRAFT_309438 [Lentithecium fluviatile CBS 122367]